MGPYASKDGPDGNHLQSDEAIPTRSNRHVPYNSGGDVNRNRINSQNEILQIGTSIPVANDSNKESEVPTVFKWEHGGRQVYITGTFNDWKKQIPMHRSGNDFTYVHNLSKGKHAYKFIVDDEWRFAPDQPTIADIEGRINNFIDVSEFIPYVGDDNFFEKSKDQKVNDSEFRQKIPELEDYTKEPPSLPPHLRHIILNKPTPTIDPQALPSPQFVSLNHLYCTAIKDGMMVLGATQRYKDKYFTIVFYSAMPTSGVQY